MNDFNGTETELFQEEPEAAARRIIREAAPYAAQTISAMAGDETMPASIRFRAAQYIIDRNLGPVGKPEDKLDELEAFLLELQSKGE